MAASKSQRIQAWDFFMGILPDGFGVGVEGSSASTTNGNTLGSIKLYFEGSATASIFKNYTLASDNHLISTRKPGAIGKSFAVEISSRVAGTGKAIKDVQLDVNVHRRR